MRAAAVGHVALVVSALFVRKLAIRIRIIASVGDTHV